MASPLFGRLVVLQIGTSTAPGKSFRDMRVVFSVKMSDDSSPNEATITAYNLAPSTIALAQDPDAVVRLLVGYKSEGTGARLIFQGNPISQGVKQDIKRADRILKIEAQDGGREITTSHVSESFATGSTTADMFACLADALGVPLGNTDAVDGDVDLGAGLVLNGRAADSLDRVAAMSGARWQIRDGALQVWKEGGSTGEEAVVFSTISGNLVGSPSPTDDGVEIVALIAPTLRPGKPFRVISELITGDYIATEVSFDGDTHGGPFHVKAKGRPIDARVVG